MAFNFLAAAAVLSALASLGGTAASMGAQSSIRKKQSAARVAEAARQADIERRRQAAMDAAVPEYSREKQEERQQSLADQITQYLTPNVDTTTQYVAQNPGAPKEVTDSMSRQLVSALEKGRNYAKNLAGVSSYGRLNFANKVGMNRLGENINRLNTESERSTNILPIEMQGAYGAGVGAQNMATILNGVAGLANAATSYSLMSRAMPPAPDTGRVVLNQPELLKTGLNIKPISPINLSGL